MTLTSINSKQIFIAGTLPAFSSQRTNGLAG